MGYLLLSIANGKSAFGFTYKVFWAFIKASEPLLISFEIAFQLSVIGPEN